MKRRAEWHGPDEPSSTGLLFCWLIVRFRVVELNFGVSAHVASWVRTKQSGSSTGPGVIRRPFGRITPGPLGPGLWSNFINIARGSRRIRPVAVAKKAFREPDGRRPTLLLHDRYAVTAPARAFGAQSGAYPACLK